MKTKLLIILSVLIATSIITTNPISAQCAYDPSQPHKPCDDVYGTLIIDPHEAQIENIDGQLFRVIGPFTLEPESNDRIRLDGVTFTYPSFPNPPMPGGPVSVTITFENGSKESIFKVGAPLPFIEFVGVDPQAGVRRNADGTFNFLLSVEQQFISPLKQIKSGVSLIDVKCNEGKVKVIKYNRMMVACVDGHTESETKLIDRGWALLRFALPGMTMTEINHSLCNNYKGKWHPEYEGCRDVTDLQCSLMGGKFVDGLKICYDGICPADKTYTLCVTNLDLISREKENKN